MKVSKDTLKLFAAAAGSATILSTASALDANAYSKKTCDAQKKAFAAQVAKLAKKSVNTIKVDDKTYTLTSVNWDKLSAKERKQLTDAMAKAHQNAHPTTKKPTRAPAPIVPRHPLEDGCPGCGLG
jgi:hypothetical protein